MDAIPSLFVWRDKRAFELDGKQLRWYDPKKDTADTFGRLYESAEDSCPFCGFTHEKKAFDGWQAKNVMVRSITCVRCGFFFERDDRYILDWDAIVRRTLTASLLKELSINDAELGLDELGSHLKRAFADSYSLAPRRFEELVEDIYKGMGYGTRLTKCTRDGGLDIVLLENSDGDQIIVECKRWAKDRKVTVDVVRQMVGVQVLRKANRARIVTTSHFTKDAEAEVALAAQVGGFEIDLVDADALLKELELYNTELPPQSTRDLLANN